jgi:hypothetical protein
VRKDTGLLCGLVKRGMQNTSTVMDEILGDVDSNATWNGMHQHTNVTVVPYSIERLE